MGHGGDNVPALSCRVTLLQLEVSDNRKIHKL